MRIRGSRQKACVPPGATDLLNQQLWCWGQDVVRPEGNWLVEVGFERTEPPAGHGDCPSLYRLELGGGRFIVLRGFGVLYADPAHGAVFLPRYDFTPRYTVHAELPCPPWTKAELPAMRRPAGSSRAACAALLRDLIEWIREYEDRVVERLGVKYRRRTLASWDNGKRKVFPADGLAAAWGELSKQVTSEFDKPIAAPSGV